MPASRAHFTLPLRRAAGRRAMLLHPGEGGWREAVSVIQGKVFAGETL